MEKPKKKQVKQENQNKSSPLPSLETYIPDGWLEIGTIVAAQGLDGEMRVYPDTDFPERFEIPGARWLLRPGTIVPEPIELLSGRYLEGKNLYVIELKGVENRNQAEEMRGCKLLVTEDDRPELGEDEYHILDLVGLKIFMSGEFIGTVTNLIAAGNDLLEVQLHNKGEDTKKTVLIPFVKEIVPLVDIENKRAEITPPEGLLELND
ncbi:16S rRNA-processing protein [Rivularia sp. IAM M-261]|nr:16S rRNA-processing protein [Calothrix sp. PCC 7716]GJD23861.1 16S rRNA-processing protein [Rivularia sp. IAM M-261]